MFKENLDKKDLNITKVESEISKITQMISDWIENIFVPQKNDIKHCFFQVKLLNEQEANKIAERLKISLPQKSDSGFFIYDKKKIEILAFNKDDFLISEEWYIKWDKNKVICYANYWNELWSF